MLKKLLSILISMLIAVIPVSCSSQETASEKSSDLSSKAPGSDSGTTKRILLPASVNTIDGEKWGFINERADFKIKPEYDGATEFNKSGIAVVFNFLDTGDEYDTHKNIYVLDTSGKVLYGPVKCKKYVITDQNIVIIDDGRSKFINKDGAVFKETENEAQDYSNGMLRYYEKVSDKSRYGFMDENGTVLIPAVYSYAEQFKGMKAKVTKNEEGKSESFLIDKKGDKYINPDGLVSFFDTAAKKYGYKDNNGQVIIEPQYDSAYEFENGAAIVQISKKGDMKSHVGLIDKKGSYLIKPEYTGIHSIGEGLYSVTQNSLLYLDNYVPGAIFNSLGEKLSDFRYYNIQTFSGECASACDDTTTFFIDKNGTIVDKMPRIKGIGTMQISDGIIICDADNVKSYYKENGDLIWSEDKSTLLKDGIKAERNIFRPDYSTYIEYPELKNLPDAAVQNKINNTLKSKIIGDIAASDKSKDAGLDGIRYPNDLEKNYNIEKNGDLIIVKETGYLFTGGAHGMPSEEYYHINYKTGDFYELADLFKKGSNYTSKLTSIIQQQISSMKKMKLSSYDSYFDPGKVKVSEKQPFEITGDYLRLYYYPYEIAPYAAGFSEFKIPYGQIADIVDTESPLWKSFDKKIKESLTMKTGSVSNYSGKQIDKLMQDYENGIIEAINSNDFSKVEVFLLSGSSLYNDQLKLTENLNKQGIKEKLNNIEILAEDYDYSKKEYKVFVNEEIAIKYAGAEFTNKKFSWCYTVKEEGGKYKLSNIESW